MTKQETFLGCARGYLLLHRHLDAVQEIEEMEEKVGFSPEGFEIATSALKKYGDLSLLIGYLDQSLGRTKYEFAPVWAGLIEAYITKGQLDSAAFIAKQAFLRFKNDPTVLLASARLQIKRGDLKLAASQLVRATSNDHVRIRQLVVGDNDFAQLAFYFGT